MKTHRQLWRPKLKEVEAQCASCPFRKGNDTEFGAVIQKLRDKIGMPGKVTKSCVDHSRKAIRIELQSSGDFACHHAAYDNDMNERPRTELRQCKGATMFFKGES